PPDLRACDMGKQELARFDFMREPGTPLAQELAVEQEGFVAHGVRLLRPSHIPASDSIMGSLVGGELSAEARPSASGATTRRRPVRALLGHVADLLLPPVC